MTAGSGRPFWTTQLSIRYLAGPEIAILLLMSSQNTSPVTRQIRHDSSR